MLPVPLHTLNNDPIQYSASNLVFSSFSSPQIVSGSMCVTSHASNARSGGNVHARANDTATAASDTVHPNEFIGILTR